MSASDSKKTKRRKNRKVESSAIEVAKASKTKDTTVVESVDDSVCNTNLSNTLNPYLGDDRCLLCRRQRTMSSANESNCKELGLAPCDLTVLPPNPLWVCTDCQRSVEDDQRWDTLDLRRIPADLLLQAVNIDMPCVGAVNAKTVISETNSSGSSCSCETCMERREMEAEQDRDTEQSHVWWMELRHAIRHLYQESGVSSGGDEDPNSFPQLDKLKDLVRRLILRNPHQLFMRLDAQLREFVIEIKLDLLKHLTVCESSPQHAREFICLMMDHYENLCLASKKASPALKQLEIEHLKRFNLTWDLMNRCLFQTHVYADHRIQNILPGVITQLRVGSTSVGSGNEAVISPFHQYLQLENEMPVFAMIWKNSEQLIQEFNDEQATMKAKQRMLKENWEIFRAHRKMMLKQQVLKKAGTPLQRCPCDECSLSHMLACGVITSLETSPQSPVPPDSVGITHGVFSYDCPTQYIPPSFLSSVVNNLEILDESLTASNGVMMSKECSFLPDTTGSESDSPESTSDNEMRNQMTGHSGRGHNICCNVAPHLDCSGGRTGKSPSLSSTASVHLCQCQVCAQSQTIVSNLRNGLVAGAPGESLTAQENKPEERQCECHSCVQHGDRALPSPVMIPPKPAALHLYPHIHGLNAGLGHAGLHVANPRLYGVHFPLPTRSKHALLPELDVHASNFQDHVCHTYLDLDNTYDCAKLLGGFCHPDIGPFHVQDGLATPDPTPQSSPASPVEHNCQIDNELHTCMRSSLHLSQGQNQVAIDMAAVQGDGDNGHLKRCGVAGGSEAHFSTARSPADGENAINNSSDGIPVLSLHSESRENCSISDTRPPLDLPQICPVYGDSDRCHGGDHEECGLDDSCSEQSSSTSTSNQKNNKHCDCCYCDLFGHDASSLTTTNRNFTETRERLRLRLTKRKNNAVGSASPDKVAPMEDCRDLDVLLNFINGSSSETQQQMRNKANKKPRQKQKKTDTKSHHMLELAKILAKTELDDDSDSELSDVEELLKTVSRRKENAASLGKAESKMHLQQEKPKGKCKFALANEMQKVDDVKFESGKLQPQVPGKLQVTRAEEFPAKKQGISKMHNAKQLIKVIGTKVVKNNLPEMNGRTSIPVMEKKCNSTKQKSEVSCEEAIVIAESAVENSIRGQEKSGKQLRKHPQFVPENKTATNGKNKKQSMSTMVVTNSERQKLTRVNYSHLKDGYKNEYVHNSQQHNGDLHPKSNLPLPGLILESSEKIHCKETRNQTVIYAKSNGKQEKDYKTRKDEKVKTIVQSLKPKDDMNSLDDIFLPRDIDLEDGNLDETERELEAFKRFCWNSVPVAKKERVQVNLKDITVKKKTRDY